MSNLKTQYGRESTDVTDNILLITPPDKIHNKNTSILLIYPSNYIKNQTQQFLADSGIGYNVYIYDPINQSEYDIDWLLDVSRWSDMVILNLDDADTEVRKLASYLISLSNVYWLTSDEDSCYYKISANRIYDLAILENLKGENFET